MSEVGRLAVAGLKRRLDAGEPTVVLDVREQDERAWCAVALPTTAVDLHVPMGQIPSRAGEVADAMAGAAGASLVVYCHHGQRSMVVARWLAARGLGPAFNLEGGIDAWSVEVDPAVRRY